MTTVNPVHTGPRRLIDGGTEKRGMGLVTIAAIVASALAVFVVGMVYSLSNRPTTTISAGYSPIADDFRALESLQSTPTPPVTTGQGGTQ
jgi:hypothetical protein